VGRALTEEWLDGEACDRCCPSVLGPFDPRALPFIGGLRALHGFIASPRLMRVASRDDSWTCGYGYPRVSYPMDMDMGRKTHPWVLLGQIPEIHRVGYG
jgi:hypothetical protein